MRFADVPQQAKKRKKRVVKKTKAITPLQAMMLRMAGTHTHSESLYSGKGGEISNSLERQV